MARKLKDKLEAVLGAGIVETAPLPVGFGLIGLELRLADGRHLAVKAIEESGTRKDARHRRIHAARA
jgi:hypothetical protein